MLSGELDELGLGVPDVRDAVVGEEDGGVVRGEEEGGEGAFVVLGYGGGLEGEAGGHCGVDLGLGEGGAGWWGGGCGGALSAGDVLHGRRLAGRRSR